jgi:hypothetical protein
VLLCVTMSSVPVAAVCDVRSILSKRQGGQKDVSELFSLVSFLFFYFFFFPSRVEEEERVPVYMSRRWGEMPFRRPQHRSNPVSSSSHQASCYRDRPSPAAPLSAGDGPEPVPGATGQGRAALDSA